MHENTDTSKPLYKQVRFSGSGWIKSIVKNLLQGTATIFDVGFIKNLGKGSNIANNIIVPGNDDSTTKVRDAFTKLSENIDSDNSSFNQDALNEFNTAMGIEKAPKKISLEPLI